MSKAIIFTGNTIAFHFNGKLHQVNSSNPQFKQIVELVKKGDLDAAVKLFDLKPQVIAALAGSKAELRGNAVFYNGQQVHSVLCQRIVTMAQSGFTVEPMLRFLENLMQNPSKRAVDELYGFLEASQLPITDDGHFLAYKSVRQDFKDHHTGKMDNSVGTLVSMDRNKVDEDKDRTCSTGLHFAAHEYAKGFGSGGRMVVLKINPRDVVAIPSDYNEQKGRACQYLVLEEVDRSDTKLVGAGVVKGATVKPSVAPTVPTDYYGNFKEGDVVRIRKGSAYYHHNYGSSNPRDIDGKVITLRKGKVGRNPRGKDLTLEVRWSNGLYNQYAPSDLELVAPVAPSVPPIPAAPAYVPEADNYKDTKRWISAKTRGIRKFIGTKEQFPVNRDVAYTLTRVSKDKEYRGAFYFTAYTAQGNLVFVRNDRAGKPEKYVTIKNLSDWVVRFNSN